MTSGDRTPGRGGVLHPIGAATEKIRAACEARRDPETVIIGRTEALTVGLTETEAIERVRAYAEAGAELDRPRQRRLADVGLLAGAEAFGNLADGLRVSRP